MILPEPWLLRITGCPILARIVSFVHALKLYILLSWDVTFRLDFFGPFQVVFLTTFLFKLTCPYVLSLFFSFSFSFLQAFFPPSHLYRLSEISYCLMPHANEARIALSFCHTIIGVNEHPEVLFPFLLSRDLPAPAPSSTLCRF